MIQDLLSDIAPAKALGISVASWTDGRVELTAPLAPNLNDKGTAFAGSIASILTLAGWAAITLGLKEHDVNADVMVVKSEIEYTSPARAALFAEAAIPPKEINRVVQELKTHGRSRIELRATLHSEGTDRASLAGSYAIISVARASRP